MQKGKATALLFRAAHTGNFDLAQETIEAGADLFAKDAAHSTPLTIASANGYLNIVELLEAAIAHHQSHSARVIKERKDRESPQVGG